MPKDTDRMLARDNLPRTWDVTLMKTCPTSPGFFTYAILCSSCASWTNRKKALGGDMSRYICCNGDWPCSGRMKEQKCPEACLCAEVFCCFAQSVASTRYLLQDEMGIRNTKCDNCIIQFMIALQVLSCLCNLAACLTSIPEIDQAASVIDLAADVVFCSVCGCMQTQAHTQMVNREQGTTVNPLEPPRLQQMNMGDERPGTLPPGQYVPYPQGPQGGPPPGYPAGQNAPGQYPGRM